MKFKAVVLLGGKTATGIQVPDEVVESLGSTKKPPVRITINGFTYRTTVAVMGGKYMVPLNAENRTAAGVAAGDEIEVGIEPDNEVREVTVPDDFAEAMEQEGEAKVFFESLSYSNKRRMILSIEDAKTPETRQRRVEKMMGLLRERKTM